MDGFNLSQKYGLQLMKQIKSYLHIKYFIIKDTSFSSCIQTKHKYSHLFVTKNFGKQLPHIERLSENKWNHL
jgi:hypothetical protein